MTDLEKYVGLLRRLGCEYRTDARFDALTTFHIGGAIPLLIVPDSVEKLRAILRAFREDNGRYFILGRGSNLLAPDEGVDYPVILLSDGEFSEIAIDGDTVTAGAGALLSKLCAAALDAGLSGLETEYGIPGTVGGGLFMNAGAYGGELADTLESVVSLTPDGALLSRKREELSFSYRHSSFADNGEIVVRATFRLKKAPRGEIRAAMDDYMTRRKTKQPLNFPSAGSVFRRPEGYFAGKLIEDAGLKGYAVGGAQVSEKHAGFIVNQGGATAEDVKALIAHIRKTVFERFGVRLETEVRSL